MTVGQRIKKARTEAGMTQEELATILGIPYQSISQWERNQRNPKRENIQRIATALCTSIAAFYDFNEDEQETIAKFERILPEMEEKLRVAKEENAPDIKDLEDKYEVMLSHADEMMDWFIQSADLRHSIELTREKAEAVLNAPAQVKANSKRTVNVENESKQKTAYALLETTFRQLNDEGQQKFLDHIKEISSLLVQIPAYQRKD